ncbi:Uncharacterised protein [Mycobacterium tuberculosis]|nr:Uncharacterised protein [Mycobacterium tuberculosis]
MLQTCHCSHLYNSSHFTIFCKNAEMGIYLFADRTRRIYVNQVTAF